MTLEVAVQYAAPRRGVPAPVSLHRWATAAAAATGRRRGRLLIRVVGAAESAVLNRRYRARAGATNVLSFGCDAPAPAAAGMLGDLVICAPVVAREARSQGKSSLAHWAHMVVHGVLHLVGYDHETSRQARVMERLEMDILARLGYPDPYCEQDAHERRST
ncbi:MAG: rRNA maturation RNase YbeY [Chromatiales bacterium 21-64-14]|nr:MAG: rRNA maturation RNase YbeY [Chromatiales bacterium 21-64-14]HQU14974.1 rRNA maturation RNase YbeY [Gammaproteobacteria bacterium]